MNLQNIEDRAIQLAISVYNRQVIEWIKEINRLKDFKSFVSLSPFNKSFRNLLEKTILLSYMRGRADVRMEVEKQLKKTKDFQEDFLTATDWTKVGFDDALLKLKNKRLISPAAFKAASAEVKNIAFSIQRIERIGAINALKEKLLFHIDTGLSFRDFQKAVPAIFDAYGVTPLKPHHLETVFRTNLGNVYNASRLEAIMGDQNVVMIQRIGVEDCRLCTICKPFINRVYPKNDPIWNIIGGQLHYNDRCHDMPITRGYATREGITVSEKPAKADFELIQKDFRKQPRNLAGVNRQLLNVLKEKEGINRILSQGIRNGGISTIKSLLLSIPGGKQLIEQIEKKQAEIDNMEVKE